MDKNIYLTYSKMDPNHINDKSIYIFIIEMVDSVEEYNLKSKYYYINFFL